MYRILYPLISLILGALLSLPAVAQGPLQVDLGPDSLHHCAGHSLTLSATTTGGTQPYTHSWAHGASGSSINFIPGDSISTWIVTVQDANNQEASDTITVVLLPECVLPGDANGDGVANNIDVLSVGRIQGATGLQRPNAHLQWVYQPAPAWGHSFPGGVNYVHGDTDGDGIVTTADFLAIDLNYGGPQQPDTFVTGTGGAPLYLEFPSGDVFPGDTLTIPVMLGTSTQQTDSIYGLAFSIGFDTYIVDTSSVIVSYDSSWLGDFGQDLMAVDHTFFGEQRVEIGITRLNSVMRRGYGRIADITVVIDDITGKTEGIQSLGFDVDFVSVIRSNGSAVAVAPQSGKIDINVGTTQIRNIPYPADKIVWSVVDQALELRWPSDWKASEVGLRDLSGRMITSKAVGANTATMTVEQLISGCYVLEVSGPLGMVRTKVLVP